MKLKAQTGQEVPSDHEGLQQRIRAAVADTLYQNIPLLQVANLFIAFIAAYTFYDYLPTPLILIWLLAMVLTSLWRLEVYRRFGRDTRRQAESRTGHWLRMSLLGSLSSGILLGITAIALPFAAHMDLVFFLLLLVVGMLAGSVSSLTAYLPTFRAYYISVSVPFISVMVYLALEAEGIESGATLAGIALMLMIYSVIVYFFGLKSHRNLMEGLRHRFGYEQISRELGREIRKREDAQEELMLASRIIANVKEGIVVTDHNNRIVRVNETFSTITGYSQDEVVGKSPSVISSGKQDKSFYQAMWRQLCHHDEWEGEIWNRRKNGEVYPEWLSISVIRDHNNEITNYVGWFRDITERKREEERLAYLANYDVLTGLPNRSLFMEQLDIALADCQERNELLAVLFIDLNLFKEVNDTYGHDVGDIVLREVSLRIKSLLREGDIVARLGGDEFILMLRKLDSVADVESVADKLLEVIKPPFCINDIKCEIGLSIGISLAPLHAQERKQLLKYADDSMYRAKQMRDGSRWLIYEGSAPKV
ncbi:MAG: diguanylate cyclase [Gammaproteobacteria bacterium]|nr:diguanylate cyclase [Gammaproteobacteria bacterium]